MKQFSSDLSGKNFPISERIAGKQVRKSILDVIQKENPDFREHHFLSASELSDYREKYITNYLEQQTGEMSALEKKVLSSINDNATLTDKIEGEERQPLTFGQRVADKVADFGGSWTFIIAFGFFLFLWIVTNALWASNQGFDPYPFILLNLILSTIAALQAPVIMMSQNRQEEKDRERAKKDYMINLKSELEIRLLHEKIDQQTSLEMELLEIQKIQIELMSEILKDKKERTNL